MGSAINADPSYRLWGDAAGGLMPTSWDLWAATSRRQPISGRGLTLSYPVFGDEPIADRVTDGRAEYAQHQTADEKRYDVGTDLSVHRGEPYLPPVQGLVGRAPEYDEPRHQGGPKDRNGGQGIVHEDARHQ